MRGDIDEARRRERKAPSRNRENHYDRKPAARRASKAGPRKRSRDQGMNLSVPSRDKGSGLGHYWADYDDYSDEEY